MQVTGRAVSHAFDGTGVLFAGLDFAFTDGEMVAITGPSGSGKSTFLSLLAGWESPREGVVTWEGIDSIAWVFQNPIGVARRTARDHVALPLVARGFRRDRADAEARAILERFGLESVDNRPFGALSGGEAQRLMLARAVAKAPSLLLVDEPTAQLDPAAAHAINEVLSEIALDHGIVVIATHDPDTRDRCPTEIDLRRHVAT